MKKLLSSLTIVLIACWQLTAQDLVFTAHVKGNFSTVGITTVTPEDLLDNNFYFVSNLSPGQSNGQIGFEIGGDVRLMLDKQFYLTSGIYFQQIRYQIEQPFLMNRGLNSLSIVSPELIDFLILPGGNLSPTINSNFVSNRRLQYIKIPFGVGAALFDNRLLIQGGFYGAMLYNGSETLQNGFNRFAAVDLVFTNNNGDLLPSPQPEDTFNDMLMGIQAGVQFNVVSKLFLSADYSRSLNTVLAEGSFSEETLTNFSIGLAWQLN